jgi:methionine sulfoxide reductase heme-binding subunit
VNQKLWWYTVRASGLVAWGLVAASVLWGMILSTRVTRRPRPPWVLDLHRFLSGLAFAFVAVHLVGLLADSFVGFGPGELTVPYASHWRPGAVAWGIVALYLLVAVEITSLLMRHLPRRVWHAIHLTSFVVFVAVIAHAFTAGADAANPLMVGFAVVTSGAAVFLLLFRILSLSIPRIPRIPRSDIDLETEIGAVPEPTRELALDDVGSAPPRQVPSVLRDLHEREQRPERDEADELLRQSALDLQARLGHRPLDVP